MTLKQKWGLSRLELLTTALLAAGGVFAAADGFRLLTQGPQTASWTGTYIIAAGCILVLLAGASLLPFSRKAAARSVSTTVADNVLEEDDEDGSKPVLDEEVPLDVARSLLIRTILLLIGWVLVLQLIGYIAATVLFLLAYGLLVSRRRVKTTLILATIATATSAALFQAIGIRLPTGNLF